MNKKIEEILPREQSGSDTGKRFDYQYDRAAEECLSLLEDNGAVSVLCEWHDDYVSEYEDKNCGATLYCFFQVKTKETHLSPWDFKDLFGLPANSRKIKDEGELEEKNRAKCESSILGRMFIHYQNFNSRCKSVVLVTNVGVDKDIQKLVGLIQNLESEKGIFLELAEIHGFKERMLSIYNIKGHNRARKAFFKLTDEMALSGRKVVQSLRKTLMKWSTEILNYFRTKITNGKTEGYNRKAKLIQRQAYGYRNFENYRLRLIYDCR